MSPTWLRRAAMLETAAIWSEPEPHTGLMIAQSSKQEHAHPAPVAPVRTSGRTHMTKFGILGAAALVASALASPAMAQEVVYNPGYCAQFYPNANCQNKGPGNPYRDPGYYQSQAYYQNGQDQGYRRDRRWRDSYNRYDNDSGVSPGDVAAGVVGGAVGTAAAIAAAPFAAPIGGDNYARLNGFVCTPGTWFRGEDGRRHLCQ